ncbi:VOC family protein [Actinoplanes sp. NEAU-A12]|uniref:VOC family protein n=1 Tax=Actinoplanes sandaracinus TaxID=3045177 RepID=A0ABT6WVQ2_9ACTN|nr:VOC family protein [Actinoplanes sandaracinus]MDI6103774.1 VOC family protein [Actinoplanes sandaracinus]
MDSAATSDLSALCFGADDPRALALFWAEFLGREVGADLVVAPGDEGGLRLRFVAARGPKAGPNQMHFDLTSASPREQERTVARALALGARHIDVGQLPEEGHVVLADPEGNEFCVIEAGNAFLAGCGFIGAVSSDGSRAVGCFWAAALGWPLVWDQGEETAIQSPAGGTKITWGGPPVAPKTGVNRLFLELVAPAGGDWRAEVERLAGLGAARVTDGDGFVDLLDPDGNEFRLLTGLS